MKITMSEIRSIPDQINSRLDSAEEKISELEAIAIEIIQNETDIENSFFFFEKGQRISKLRDNFKWLHIYNWSL